MTAEVDPVVDMDDSKIDFEPDWLTGNLGKYPVKFSPLLYPAEPVDKSITRPPEIPTEVPLQQSDLLKPLLMDIAHFGLTYAYHKYRKCEPIAMHSDPCEQYKKKKTKRPQNVIIVGAGMAGLVAAYELAQVGHKVQILEMQERVGGRVKTFGEKDGFAKNLYVDGGAMRLPSRPKDPVKIHFMTDFYASQLFDLPLVDFNNQDDNAFLKFYNMVPMQAKKWNEDPDKYFSKHWYGWDKTIVDTGAKEEYRIKSIDDYYSHTMDAVTKQLRQRIASATSYEEQSDVWTKWIDNWCRFPMNGFLRSNYDAIIAKIDPDYREGLEILKKFLPWSEAAITAYSVYNYTQQLDQSLVEYLRDELGHWWSPHMHHIEGGMSKLPEKFTEKNTCGWNHDVHLQENITYNVTVNEVEYTSPVRAHGEGQRVVVRGYFTTSGRPFQVEGNAIIITVPPHIIRQITIINAPDTETPPFPSKFYKAIEDIWVGPSTKIMIQSRTRFWEEYNIKGGFTKTNLPIGQIHYPTAVDAITNPNVASVSERGILLCYTWKSEALLFGSLNPQVAIREAVHQIAHIHEEIEDEFEVGAIQAWYNDPSAQGAYVLLKPEQYKNVHFLMTYPWRNIYFAGEGISFASGWIQGALESGLRAAYQFFARNEKHVPLD